MKQQNKNPFVGDTPLPMFCRLIYRRVRNREEYTLKDIFAEYLKIYYPDIKDIPKNKKIGEHNYNTLYKDLKNANRELRALLPEIENVSGKPTVGAVFQYKGEEVDPLKDKYEYRLKKCIGDYRQFCQDSSDLISEPWFRHFFADTEDLLEVKKARRRGEQIVFSSANRKLKNNELLPKLYEYIKAKRVLTIMYRKFDGKEFTYTFHPHCLKQYNERWFLFGYNDKYNSFTNLAVDRIEEIGVDSAEEYRAPEKIAYPGYFSHRVGVSNKLKDDDGKEKDIRIRAYTLYMYGLISSKPIHGSQKPIGEYDEDKGYGDFMITVVPNNELLAQILLWGEGVEIISPDSIRNTMKRKVDELHKRYEKPIH